MGYCRIILDRKNDGKFSVLTQTFFSRFANNNNALFIKTRKQLKAIR